MASPASDLLGAALSDAERRDREAMNLKMEISHLRERLLLRVGGDAAAAALEAETFALNTALADAQASAARAQQALQALDAKYAKALRNLVKMDQAWKTSAAELAHTQQQLRDKDAALARLEQQRADDAAERQACATRQNETIAALEATVRAQDAAAAGHAAQLHALALQTKELEAELEATRRRSAATPEDRVARAEWDALETRHQQAMEAAAALRGETNALRDERASLQSQLSDTKASLTAAMAKFLQLKEENATLEVRVAAAHEKSGQCERDAAFYKTEVDRIQGELTKRDEDMLQLERANQVLELKLSQQQRLAEDAVQERDHEAKRLELKHERSWKDREFELENEVRALKKQCEALENDAESVRAFHDELRETLGWNGQESQDLKSLVAQAVEQISEAAFTAEQQQKQVNRLEKELTRMKALADENASLKAEYEKTRLAMERIVGRKSKATANTQRFATGGGVTTSSAVPATGSLRGSSNTSTPVKTSSATSTKTAMLQRRTIAEKTGPFVTNTNTNSIGASTANGTKRKLELPSTREPDTRTMASDDSGSSTIFSPRSKRVVHVASRYLQQTTKR